MKTIVKIGMAMMIALTLTCCKHQEKVVQTEPPKPLVLPCSEFKDDAYFYRDMGVGTDIDLGNSRLAALENAKQMIKRRLGGKVTGVSRDYSLVLSGQGSSNNVQRQVQSGFEQAIDKLLNDAANVCETTLPLNDGNFQTFYAIEISKDELIQKTIDILLTDEELKMETNKDQFIKLWKVWKDRN